MIQFFYPFSVEFRSKFTLFSITRLGMKLWNLGRNFCTEINEFQSISFQLPIIHINSNLIRNERDDWGKKKRVWNILEWLFVKSFAFAWTLNFCDLNRKKPVTVAMPEWRNEKKKNIEASKVQASQAKFSSSLSRMHNVLVDRHR